MEQIPHRPEQVRLPPPPAAPAASPLFTPLWQERIWFGLYVVAMLYQAFVLYWSGLPSRAWLVRQGISQDYYLVDAVFMAVSFVMIVCSLGLPVFLAAVMRYSLAYPGGWQTLMKGIIVLKKRGP